MIIEKIHGIDWYDGYCSAIIKSKENGFFAACVVVFVDYCEHRRFALWPITDETARHLLQTFDESGFEEPFKMAWNAILRPRKLFLTDEKLVEGKTIDLVDANETQRAHLTEYHLPVTDFATTDEARSIWLGEDATGKP